MSSVSHRECTTLTYLPADPNHQSIEDRLKGLTQELPQVVGQLGTLERQGDVGLQQTHLIPDVVPGPLELTRVDLLEGKHCLESIGQLDFAVLARLCMLDGVEDAGRQDVATDDGKVAGSIGGFRLLHQPRHFPDAGRDGGPLDDTVAGGVLTRDLHDGHDHPRIPAGQLLHLYQAGRRAVDDVVRQQDRERVAVDERTRLQNRVSQTAWQFLTDIVAVSYTHLRAHETV